MSTSVLYEAPALPYPRLHKGKVRELFQLDDERLLMVATDRLSAFDVVFPQGIPAKGRVLNSLSALWFRATVGITLNHLITTDMTTLGLDFETTASLQGRAAVVKRTKRIDVECVVRGYLAGSGWKEYQQSGTVCGIPLPSGLKLNAKLPEPIWTPAIKNDVGHDENVPEARIRQLYGSALTNQLKARSLALYEFAAAQTLGAGIILADTKFEFGRLGDQLLLIDEIFTPDSSRYWPLERYVEGEPIDSLDKQPVRDYVEAIGWDKSPPAPILPESLIEETSRRYEGVLERLNSLLA
ncbi:MAG TPA: phosphoribosylaminoimidazolesuccinocarboxamide synthase [Symbiobacteriaceae bacterium]|nr:phosphoribosylaminoimidazolesuccinocarboxamide synthase [Symbiobacteriaceae bacterium]